MFMIKNAICINMCACFLFWKGLRSHMHHVGMYWSVPEIWMMKQHPFRLPITYASWICGVVFHAQFINYFEYEDVVVDNLGLEHFRSWRFETFESCVDIRGQNCVLFIGFKFGWFPHLAFAKNFSLASLSSGLFVVIVMHTWKRRILKPALRVRDLLQHSKQCNIYSTIIFSIAKSKCFREINSSVLYVNRSNPTISTLRHYFQQFRRNLKPLFQARNNLIID